jgi:hypothetical protein
MIFSDNDSEDKPAAAVHDAEVPTSISHGKPDLRVIK